MSLALSPMAMALLQARRDNRLVAYARQDQVGGCFCCGWFLRFEDDFAIFLDVPSECFGGLETEVHLAELLWVMIDSPYLRGLEQLWMVSDPTQSAIGRQFTEFEYIETVLKEAWEQGQVVSIRLSDDCDAIRVQVLEVEGNFVCVQELNDDDASSQGIRWCRTRDLLQVEKDSAGCLKMEALLGMPRRVTQPAER
ncbi:MAG: hypothetical protein JNK63_02070 [Chthonomonas sp.]|nr:hypothetical protein [Chthonomonas sp.]